MIVTIGRRVGVAVLGAVAWIAGLAAVAPASAQNRMGPVANPTGIINSFDIATIEPILREMTSDVQRITLFGRESLRANFGGRVLLLTPNACGEGVGATCAGLYHFMFFQAAMSDSAVNAYNANAFIAHAANANDGTSVFIRYAFCDYGCARGTVAAGILNYLRASDGYMEALQGGPSGGATQVSASVEPAKVTRTASRKRSKISPAGQPVAFTMPADAAGVHNVDGATPVRLNDWVASDLFTNR